MLLQAKRSSVQFVERRYYKEKLLAYFLQNAVEGLWHESGWNQILAELIANVLKYSG